MMGEDKLGAALGELYQAVQVTAQKHYDESEPSPLKLQKNINMQMCIYTYILKMAVVKEKFFSFFFSAFSL